jgi:hypothetical protein
MTPLKAAKQECANCDSAGNCAGVGIADDGRLFEFRSPGRCYLAENPWQRCAYFEQCVAPLAQTRLRAGVTQEQRNNANKLAEGVHAYEMAVMPAPTVKYAKCKRCQRQVHPPKRLCAQCAKNRTLKAKRQWWAKTRKNNASEALITSDL